MDWAIQHFKELKLTFGELKEVPRDALAIFAISSYAVSELNVIARVRLSAFHTSERDDATNAACFIQNSCMLRYWTLKLFEFFDCVNGVSVKRKKYEPNVVDVTVEAVENFSFLKDQTGFTLARDVRNEATGHYSLDAARKNLKFVGDSAIATMYVHEKNGNSFYPLGEEVMFVGRLNRFGARFSSDAEKSRLLNELYSWNSSAHRWVLDCHKLFFNSLIMPHLKDKYARKTSYWMNPKKVGSLEGFNTPIFASGDLVAPR